MNGSVNTQSEERYFVDSLTSIIFLILIENNCFCFTI
jgi:hypothetical protein